MVKWAQKNCLSYVVVDCTYPAEYTSRTFKTRVLPSIELREDPIDRHSDHSRLTFGTVMNMLGEPSDRDVSTEKQRVSCMSKLRGFICPVSTPDGIRSGFELNPCSGTCVSRFSMDVYCALFSCGKPGIRNAHSNVSEDAVSSLFKLDDRVADAYVCVINGICKRPPSRDLFMNFLVNMIDLKFECAMKVPELELTPSVLVQSFGSGCIARSGQKSGRMQRTRALAERASA